ncbi:MAG TPA: sigma 54-interacting transcriptional regulator [Myxococcales bacterium]|nr:sigma 54-interacting transcriptional regulator [Myxococcales bacterium]
MGTDDSRDATRTIEHAGRGARGAPQNLGPLLFRLVQGDDLSERPERHPLTRVREVEIGRAIPGIASSDKTLRIELRDAFASSRHAHLERDEAGWSVRDEGSKNGTHVNTERVPAGASVPLRDGDLVEVGHTFFLFRGNARGVWEPGPQAIEESADPPTLCPEWEYELGKAERLSRTAHEVLIEGESGSGKEVLARFLHERSGRRGPLVSVNCAALPENLFEDELFGHVRGAFSGAQSDRQGLVRAADGGTLFLDEVGEIPVGLQAKLLRVLEDHQVRPLGAEREVPVDVRVVAATNRNLEELVEQGKFRPDLLARLGLLSVRVPSLRERREDLGLLIRAILQTGNIPLDRIVFELDALRLVLRHSWPLNVRELRRALLAAVDLAGPDEEGVVRIRPDHLPQAVRDGARRVRDGAAPEPDRPPLDLTDTERTLRDTIVEHLRRAKGNVSDVAREMGKGRTQIQRWIARFRIDVEALRRTRE